MKPRRYAVAEKRGDWKWVTTFYRVDHVLCSSPIVREGHVDTLRYKFKRLTEAEYETYLEMGVLVERNSDEFVVVGIDPVHWQQLEDRQAIFELGELDDVFDQQE